MSESTSTASVVATRAAKVITFDNHLPLRTRQIIREIWLGYDYLDFGGNYFEYCACIKHPGKYHCWHQNNPAYNDQKSTTTYIGLFGDYEELVGLLAAHDYGHREQGKIIEYLAESFSDGAPGEIEIPEC